MGRTLFDKLWDIHAITSLGDEEWLLSIDRIFLHERTGAVALKNMQKKGWAVRNPGQVFCTIDHIVDTFPGRGDETLMPNGKAFILATREAALATGITLFDINDARQGIMHVISPEQGIALPGLTVVCPDSHSCTLGGIGALAWGIGSTEAEHAMVTQTLRVKKPRNMRVRFTGRLAVDVGAKDMALHLIKEYSVTGGQGFAVEFCGPAVAGLCIEARLTLCNMAVEFSAFTSIVAPDDKTLEYVKDRPYAPRGDNWSVATAHWNTLFSDPDAHFERELEIDCSAIQACVTWGTSPQHLVALGGKLPAPELELDPARRQNMLRAYEYMDLKPGDAVSDIKLDAAFIGSCTNARLSDLRLAAKILRDRKIAPWMKAVCVPGSTQTKLAAEAEGLDRVFKDAGFEWRESGCSMCLYAGGETFGPGKRVISSTNRNFEGRQGPGTRTHLASPATVAASACAGYIRSAADT